MDTYTHSQYQPKYIDLYNYKVSVRAATLHHGFPFQSVGCVDFELPFGDLNHFRMLVALIPAFPFAPDSLHILHLRFSDGKYVEANYLLL